MLTLSDELKLDYSLPTTYVDSTVGYSLYIFSDTLTDTLIYKGSVYYTGTASLYYKDIIESYVNDYSWFDKLGFTKGIAKFKVKVVFTTGTTVTSDYILNKTEIPTVEIKTIPSILPKYPSINFKFAWLYPDTTTSISIGPKKDEQGEIHQGFIMSDYGHWVEILSTTSLLHYRYGVCESIWRHTTDKIEKIAEFDECNSRFYLIWITRDNDFKCRPFCKRSDLNESVSTKYVSTVVGNKKPYLKTSNYKFTLNSDWLTFDESNTYESLLISPIVYLYDNTTGKTHEVIVTNSDWTERNSNNTKKPFNLTVTVEMVNENNITY